MRKLFYLCCVSYFGVLPKVLFAATVTVPSVDGLPDYGKDGIATVIGKILSFVTGFLAVLAVLMIVISGIMYISSVGDDSKVSQAKNMLTYSIVGLVVALLGYVIVIGIASALGVNW